MPPVSCSSGVPDVLAFQPRFQQRLLGLLAGEFVAAAVTSQFFSVIQFTGFPRVLKSPEFRVLKMQHLKGPEIRPWC